MQKLRNILAGGARARLSPAAFGLFAAGLLAAAAAAPATLSAVPTDRHPVTNVYHGVSVRDDYQWLEDAAAPAVGEWSRRQNERTRAYFETLPARDGFAQHLEALRGEESARCDALQRAAGRIFALRFKPPAQQAVLVELSSVEPPTLHRVVFDPNRWNSKGTTSIDWYQASHDGRRVAICLSEHGSEDGVLHFVETDGGAKLTDEIPRVQYPTGGGSMAWNTDGSGVFYTRYPHRGERPEADLHFYQQVCFHQLGTAVSSDRYEVGREFPRIAEIDLESASDGPWVLAKVANGDGGEFAHYLREATGQWRQLTRFDEGIKRATFGKDDALYLLSRSNAPYGQILRLPLAQPDLALATVVVREVRRTISDYVPVDGGLYVSRIDGGPSELTFHATGRRRPQNVPVPALASVSGLHDWGDDTVLFGRVTHLDPFAYHTWQPGWKRSKPTALRMTSPADFSDVEVVREFAPSPDGTLVPLNILRRKGTRLDGRNPAWLYGYGGYGISLTPSFDSTRRVWFDAGGVYVVANLRGGGEYGSLWHMAGNLTRKQNVFDDFIAAAEHLIRRKYTSSAKLVVEGGSNGGLLMGAFLTQRPDLARAVVAHVGIYDMLRVERDPNGQFNVTEFGSVTDPDQFAALHAYSPYHRVRDDVRYPAVLLATGEHDGRVNPAHSRKMTARLRAATSSGHPILYRSTATAGHGIGSSLNDRLALQADVYAFVFDQLGLDTSRWQFRSEKR